MVVGWAPWWIGQTERTTFLTVGDVQRCLGYDGFFTRDNVAALTEAAGHQER